MVYTLNSTATTQRMSRHNTVETTTRRERLDHDGRVTLQGAG